jgi:hypothetical protein
VKPSTYPSRSSKKRFKWRRFKKAKLPEGKIASIDNFAVSLADLMHLDPVVLGTAGRAGISRDMSRGRGSLTRSFRGENLDSTWKGR